MKKILKKNKIKPFRVFDENGKHLCSIECADDVNMKIKNFINN